MLVSHRYRFIYTKTGKTGGTSVELYFEPYCVGSQPQGGNGRQAQGERVSDEGIVGFRGPRRPAEVCWWNHMAAAEIKCQLGDTIWNSYFKFCTVRNPFDRLISRFFHVRRSGQFDADPTLPDFAQFERWLLTRRKGPGDRNRYLIAGKFCLDDVIRFEQLQADAERMCNRLGVPWDPAAFPHAKGGQRPADSGPAKMYTEKAEEIVRKQYALEFELFGYSDRIERVTEHATPEIAAVA